MLLALRERGVTLAFVTLHIGLDTFKPVAVEVVADHPIHTEWASLSPEVAQQINQAKLAGGRLVAVGTTAVRTLETAALRSAGVTGSLRQASRLEVDLCPWRPVAAFEGPTDLFIYPGFRFRAVDCLLTNFHLPRSSLLMLVSAFGGGELMRRAYQVAIAERPGGQEGFHVEPDGTAPEVDAPQRRNQDEHHRQPNDCPLAYPDTHPGPAQR